MKNTQIDENPSTPEPEKTIRYDGMYEPFNYSRIMDAVMVPRVIAQNRKLPPGARILWGVIRMRMSRDGICTSPDFDLANELGVSVRQFRRYCRALEKERLIVSKERPGKSVVRATTKHPCLDGTILHGYFAKTTEPPAAATSQAPSGKRAKPVSEPVEP